MITKIKKYNRIGLTTCEKPVNRKLNVFFVYFGRSGVEKEQASFIFLFINQSRLNLSTDLLYK